MIIIIFINPVSQRQTALKDFLYIDNNKICSKT